MSEIAILRQDQFSWVKVAAVMRRRLRLFGVVLLACFAPPDGTAQMTAEQPKTQHDVPAKYAATAFGQSAGVAGQVFELTVHVHELTSDSDIEELASTLRHKGQDGLARVLERINYKGRISPNGSVGIGMRFVRIRRTKDGGEHIVLATPHPRWEQQHKPSDIYEFMELDVDKDGKGSGSFVPLCKVKFNDRNELEIEEYGWKTFRLVNVYREN